MPTTTPKSRAPHKVVGDIASQQPGTGTTTTPSSDWMGEMGVKKGDAKGKAKDTQPQGVPISTHSPRDKQRGKAIESKRGQQ